jgi:hypothetical protein
MGFFNEIKKAVSNPGKAISNIGSSFDDAILKPIKDAGSSIEDEFDRALADPVLGPIINIVAATYGGPAAVAALKYKQTGELSDALEAGAKAYIIQNVVSGATSADPNAVGGVTGPDNIDVGGGFNPADGAAGAAGAGSVVVSGANAPDNIDIGGGFNPAAGATPAELATARAAMVEKGLTFNQAINYVRGGLLVNSLVGDPLGLAGEQPSGGGGGFAGFEQVPIPADWRSPTYAASSAPIDLSSIFTDQNLLAGTQWQGLPQQQNVSFNDIFASGQQQTPMGNMVDINQIVSAILGQNTASQKSA